MLSHSPCRRASLCATTLVAAALFATAPSSRAERPRVYALTHATVVPAPGQKLEDATVVLRDGLIESVGKDAKVPPDALETDTKGQWIYPGLLDAAFGPLPSGADEAAAAPPRPRAAAARGGARETPSGPVHPLSRVRPERRASDRLLPFEGDRKRDAATYRNLGFTIMVAALPDGIFRGTSAAFLLADETPVAKLLLVEDAAQQLGFDRGGFGEGYPTSLMGAVAAIRQTFLDAQRYATWTARWGRNPHGLPRPERAAAYDALLPVLEGRRRAFFEAGDPQDVLLADRIAREFGLDAAIVASGHEWEIAEQVAATGRTLLHPVRFPDKPKVDDADEALDATLREMRRYLDAPEAPKRLAQAGIPFAFTLRGLKNPADFPRNVRKMLDAGLSEELALAALTTVPARLLGTDKVSGTIEPGKIGNLVVLDGPLFGKDAKVREVFVDGAPYEVEEKKKPKGDPNAVVDPRGTWSVVLEFRGQVVTRTWTIGGGKGAYSGTAETRAGTVSFERVELAGNMLTVTFPPAEGRGAFEVTVVITGDTFEGEAEMGPMTVPVKGTRTKGPEGGAR